MTKIALISSEPIRHKMAGIGIRYHEIATHLALQNFDVRIYAQMDDSDGGKNAQCAYQLEKFRPECFEDDLADFDVIIAQGLFAELIATSGLKLPIVFDLCDPYLIENLSYYNELGDEVFNKDRKGWDAQLRRGDFFLCSTEKQRLYNIGWLTALGRFPVDSLDSDPALMNLVGLVPYGVPRKLPEHRRIVQHEKGGKIRILFGGIYDWFDPWTLLDAIKNRPEYQVIFVSSPNPETTPQNLYSRVKEYCLENAIDENQFKFLDWVPHERRFDLLRDVDMLIAPHIDSLETQMSLRTRFIEAMRVGCPVITSDGGEVSDFVSRNGGGIVVPTQNVISLEQAIDSVNSKLRIDPAAFNVSSRVLSRYSWDQVLRPLVLFCKNPLRIAQSVEAFNGDLKNSVVKGDVQPLFSIVLPTFNRMDILPDVIDAIEGQKNTPTCELVIINDGSSDGTSEWLRSRSFSIPTNILEINNQGPAKARIEALKHVNGEYVMLMGDDMVPDPFWLHSHWRAHKQRGYSRDLAVIGHTDWHKNTKRTQFLDFIDRTGWQFSFDTIEDPENVPYNYFYGSNLSIPASWLEKESFNQDFPYPAWEDIELGYRLTRRGVKIVYEPAARVQHSHQTTIKRFVERHWKTGYSAVTFYQLHPELENLFWPSQQSLEQSNKWVIKSGRLLFARILERFPVKIPGIWNLILRDSYVNGVQQALKNNKLPDAKNDSSHGPLPIKYNGSSPLLRHNTGEAVENIWVCIEGKHKKGHCIFGPYYKVEVLGNLQVEFDVSWNHRAEKKTIANVDVYDSSKGIVLCEKNIGNSPAENPVKISFSGYVDQILEFRVYWHGLDDFVVNMITLDLVNQDASRNGKKSD